MTDREVLPSNVEVRAAVRRWLARQSSWQDRFEVIRALSPRDLFRTHQTLAEELVSHSCRDHEKSVIGNFSESRSILEGSGYVGLDTNVELLSCVHDELLAQVKAIVGTLFDQTFYPERVVAAQQVVPASPLFSAGTNQFLDEKQYGAQAHRQNTVTFRLWIELIGDMPCRSYTGESAANFRNLLLSLPASHGKGGKVSVQDAIQIARDRNMPRLSGKTAKRHFSALSQYWRWLKLRGAVDANIFLGFSFPVATSMKSKRDAWSSAHLKTLFEAPEWKNAPRDSAWHWLPLLSLHSGLRLEEACRLRPNDIERILGIWCLRIRDHPDGWSPKTEAGERDVPVHSWLISHGFIDLVDRRRQEGALHIFSELIPGGPDQRLGFAFSRSFSKMLRDLRIPARTTFHSFRHTFRTLLEETDHLDRHLAAIGGWEREAKDEGSRTYAKRIARLVPKLREVVEDFRPPLDIGPLVVRSTDAVLASKKSDRHRSHGAFSRGARRELNR